MKTYNLSNIMKHAWRLFKEGSIKLSFGECLRAAWKQAKKSAAKAEFVKRNIVIVDLAKWFVKKMDAVSFMALESGIAVNDVVLEKETEKAVMISTEWNGYRKAMWIPKSLITFTFA